MEANPQITYNRQFRSARPIRKAQVRSSQLSSHYDSMSAEKKGAFEASAAKFVAADFADRVVVSVTFHTDVANYARLMRNYWASQSQATLSMSVFFEYQQREAQPDGVQLQGRRVSVCLSARPKQVRPDEKISVEFVHPDINVIRQQRILQEFNLKKMLLDGQPGVLRVTTGGPGKTDFDSFAGASSRFPEGQ